jgi:penicillin-binding protein 1A
MVYLDRIEDASGRVVYRHRRPSVESRPVLDDATAWQVHSMMAGSLERGSSSGALDGLLEKPFSGAGKGGSTHDFSDAWFLGYNQRITCGVWTGFLTSSGEPIYPGAFSRDLALPVWQAAMNAAAPSFGGTPMTPPPSVVQLAMCTVSGQRATQFCQEQAADLQTGAVRSLSTAVTEYFRAGTEQLPFCGVHSGGLNEAVNPALAINNLPAMDTSPVQPQQPVLIGDDPYHTEVPSFAANTSETGFVRRRTNVLDSLDLGEVEEQIPLKRPERLQIQDE